MANSKFFYDTDRSEKINGIATFVTVVFCLISIVVLLLFLVALLTPSEIGGNGVGIAFAIFGCYLISVVPTYVVLLNLIKGFAVQVEASEKLSAYIDYINEKEEEESK